MENPGSLGDKRGRGDDESEGKVAAWIEQIKGEGASF